MRTESAGSLRYGKGFLRSTSAIFYMLHAICDMPRTPNTGGLFLEQVHIHELEVIVPIGREGAVPAGVTVDDRILIVLKKVEGRWLIAADVTVVRDQP